MPRTSFQKIPPAADQATWLEWAEATRSPRMDPANPAFRPFRDAGIDLLGQDILKEKFHAGTPCSPTHLLWIVTRGSVTVDFGEGPRVLEKGQMALCPALRPHWVRLDSGAARGLWFHILRIPRWQHLSNAGPGIHASRLAAEMEWLLEHCLRECAATEFGAGQNALHYAEILAVLLERELAAFAPRRAEQAPVTRIDSLWGEVILRPNAKWSVASLARGSGTSTRELHRLCADLYGIGPMGLVTRIRMDRAMELLLATDRKLDDIAAEVGYATAHAFSAAFLSHVGRRPGSFRVKNHLTTSETCP
jgi:AraC family transcriptional regulator